MGLPSTLPPKSSTAIFTASTEPGAGEVGVEAGHVGEHADLDHVVGDLASAARAGARGEGQQRDEATSEGCGSCRFLSCAVCGPG